MNDSAELFRHVSAEKAAFYRSLMAVFAAAKRQYRLQLRPDEVLAEGQWPGDEAPRIEEISAGLAQLAAWGNLESQPDTARVANLSDFYRARFLYRLSVGGEAVAGAVVLCKRRLVDYLERFIGDLVRRSDTIARLILGLAPQIDVLLGRVAEREARDAAPGDATDSADALQRQWQLWRERWRGLRGWFLSTGNTPPQAELLRGRARSAIPQLLGAIAAINERRSGRSDRSADFRRLAVWFAQAPDGGAAHRLARAAFALHPARHLGAGSAADIEAAADLPAATRWADAPPLAIHPRLREYGEASARGPAPRVRAG